MLFVKSLILLCSFNLAFSQKKKDFTCVPMDVCQCQFHNGLGINLNELDVTFNSTNEVFALHPCENVVPKTGVFSNCTNCTVANNDCKEGSSLCFYKKIDLEHFEMINLGLADSFEFQTSLDGKEINFISKYNSWITTIHLKCSTEDDADQGVLSLIEFNNNARKIEMNLISKKSCLTYEFSSVHLGSWTIFFIVLCTLALIYFVGGALLLRFLFDAEGINMIPHHTFWNKALSCLKEIPVCSYCCRSSSGYDEI